MQPSYWCKSTNGRNQDMRLIFITISLLCLWILPNQICAHTEIKESVKYKQKDAPITNKLIALFKKCQKLTRKISPKTSSIQEVSKENQSTRLITTKPELSIISSRKKSAREAMVERHKTNSLRTTELSRKKKSGWSFLNIFSQLRGPAPFARR